MYLQIHKKNTNENNRLQVANVKKISQRAYH